MGQCKILAEVIIESAAVPGAGYLICFIPVGQPLLCTAGLRVNQFLQLPGAREVARELSGVGCQLAVQGSQEVGRIIVARGAKSSRDLEEALWPAKRTFRAVNTSHGLRRLMDYLAKGGVRY